MANTAFTTPVGVSKTLESITDQNSALATAPKLNVATAAGKAFILRLIANFHPKAGAPANEAAESAVVGGDVATADVPGAVSASKPQAYMIEGVLYAALDMPCKPEWYDAAQSKGFTLLGRAKDRYTLVVQCHSCGALSLIRLNVVRDHNPLCHPCIDARRTAAAATLGVKLLARDPGSPKHGQMRLSCGHKVRRQYSRLEAAAAGGHALGCDECREARYAKEAHKHDWLLVGPAKSGRAGYRSYDHHCGHRQDIMIGNMLWGDCVCAGCGKGWSAKKSFIYLFKIPLPGLPVLKLGYSARPEKRLRHQLGIDPAIKTEVLRVIELPKGNRAISEERTCHRHMNTWHPELVVPKAEFGDRINTQGEIYRFEAADTLNVLMDGIALRYRQT